MTEEDVLPEGFIKDVAGRKKKIFMDKKYRRIKMWLLKPGAVRPDAEEYEGKYRRFQPNAPSRKKRNGLRKAGRGMYADHRRIHNINAARRAAHRRLFAYHMQKGTLNDWMSAVGWRPAIPNWWDCEVFKSKLNKHRSADSPILPRDQDVNKVQTWYKNQQLVGEQHEDLPSNGTMRIRRVRNGLTLNSLYSLNSMRHWRSNKRFACANRAVAGSASGVEFRRNRNSADEGWVQMRVFTGTVSHSE
eukprot:TRINITY_DN54744_c0_g1_i1.p1 TRINITY_DN54744_c0_g1~~TRINITY_DN54744_c0_g1_i1.p1  ORF type:complete len:246 (+),score=20.60 TRINITY_DN54744_c0_g1_i1:28-765(+)